MRVISVASFVTDIITPSRHHKCKAGCRTNSFRVDDKNCDFPEYKTTRARIRYNIDRRGTTRSATRGRDPFAGGKFARFSNDKIAVDTIEGRKFLTYRAPSGASPNNIHYRV